jgi:predicted RNA-binding protein (virulence factor B family)
VIEVGRTQELLAAERNPHGLLVTDGITKILLPNKYVPAQIRAGDPIVVFVTTDSEDRLVATTQRPKGEVGDFVALKVKEVSHHGAFLDWGLDKDILVPFAEQRAPLRAGFTVMARILLDGRTNRVVASTKLQKFLGRIVVRDGQIVEGLIADIGADGVRVIIDGKGWGMIFPDEVHGELRIGDRRKMYVKRIREDGSIALTLSPAGFAAAQDLGPAILERLRKEGGFLPLSDTASPEEIREAFGVSKGTYKKAIGNLMRQGKIVIEHHGIRQV